MNQNPCTRISIVMVSHMNSGKSVTTVDLIFKCGAIDKRTINKKEATEQGNARNIDNLKAEHEKGMAIDISLWWFESPNFDFTAIDAPGHCDFIKNMVTGTTQTSATLHVVDNPPGGFESGMASDRQAREHSLLTMRVKQIIVVVNKMDDVNYSKNQFENVKGKLPNLQSVIYLFQWVGRR